jgi:hypothetical protein
MSTDANLDERLAEAADEWRREVDGLFATLDWPNHPRRHGLAGLLALTRWRVVAAGAVAAVAIALTLGIVLTRPDGPTHHAPAVDCAAPALALRPAGEVPAVVAPGQAVTVVGRFWVDGCRENSRGEAPAPIAAVQIVLHTSDGHTRPLAVAHPRGDAGTFRVEVAIPRGSPAGAATLEDAGGKSIRAIALRIS